MTRRALIAALVIAAAGCRLYREIDAPLSLDVVLGDAQGQEVNLGIYKGKPLVINFWATWCGPCQREMPQLVALAAKHAARGLVVIGISTDDPPSEIQAFARQFGITYPLFAGRNRPQALEALGFSGLMPTTLFVTRGGITKGRLIGAASDEFMERKILEILDAPERP